jgi:Arc/MetJ-type ribon-helix-helix transcriptional regulator
MEKPLLEYIDESMAKQGFNSRSEYIRQSIRESVFYRDSRTTSGGQLQHVMATHDKIIISDNLRNKLVREGKVFYHGADAGETTSRDVVIRRKRNNPDVDGDSAKQDGPVTLRKMELLRRDGGVVLLRGNLSLANVEFGRLVYIPPGTPIRVDVVDGEPLKTMQGRYPVDAPEEELPGYVGQYTVHELHDENKRSVIEAYRKQWAACAEPHTVRMPWENSGKYR